MSISVTLSDITAAAKQQLSIIGKHHKTASGETLFSTATLSSLEESAMRHSPSRLHTSSSPNYHP